MFVVQLPRGSISKTHLVARQLFCFNFLLCFLYSDRDVTTTTTGVFLNQSIGLLCENPIQTIIELSIVYNNSSVPIIELSIVYNYSSVYGQRNIISISTRRNYFIVSCNKYVLSRKHIFLTNRNKRVHL